MNRIERLLWERTHLNEIEGSERRRRGARGVKLLSIVVLAVTATLLVSRISPPPVDDALVQAISPAPLVYPHFAQKNAARDGRAPREAAPRSANDTEEETTR